VRSIAAAWVADSHFGQQEFLALLYFIQSSNTFEAAQQSKLYNLFVKDIFIDVEPAQTFLQPKIVKQQAL